MNVHLLPAFCRNVARSRVGKGRGLSNLRDPKEHFAKQNLASTRHLRSLGMAEVSQPRQAGPSSFNLAHANKDMKRDTMQISTNHNNGSPKPFYSLTRPAPVKPLSVASKIYREVERKTWRNHDPTQQPNIFLQLTA
jgi:hypothetical protein